MIRPYFGDHYRAAEYTATALAEYLKILHEHPQLAPHPRIFITQTFQRFRGNPSPNPGSGLSKRQLQILNRLNRLDPDRRLVFEYLMLNYPLLPAIFEFSPARPDHPDIEFKRILRDLKQSRPAGQTRSDRPVGREHESARYQAKKNSGESRRRSSKRPGFKPRSGLRTDRFGTTRESG